MKRSLLTLIAVSAAACTTTTGESGPVSSTIPPVVSGSTGATTTVTTTSSSTPAGSTTTTERLPDAEDLELVSFPLPAGSGPHDVAPALDGGVWYTAQGSGGLGWLDPATGETRHIDLGPGSRPHGVIVDPGGNPWVTDGGLNAIISVDPDRQEPTLYRLPDDRPDANLNTASFDEEGNLWFTGQSGIYGRLDPSTGDMEVFDAPEGRGPYGMTTTPEGVVYYASLAGSHIARIEDNGDATVIEPSTPDQGARRVWSDSEGRIWVSEWNAGSLSRFTPETGTWGTWHLPGDAPQAYAVFVDDLDVVWASDFGSNSVVRFDPVAEEFDVFALPSDPGNVRQIHGRPGEVWLPESAADNLVVIRKRSS
ncbi:MAG: virginiamycin B lyase family protein [Acidimicrobiia bacterium]